MNIAIIGAGQLGSRHLQALAPVGKLKKIFVVDPCESSLETAKVRFKEAHGDPAKLECSQKLENINSEIHTAVISTTANVRLKAMKDLLKGRKVKYVILEKIAFLNESSFAEAENLIAANKTKAWVNCPRRMYPFYQKLKSALSTQQEIDITVRGFNFGLGCNGIHYIDLAAMLNNCDEYVCDCNQLDKKIRQTKRQGCYEFTGTIKGTFANNAEFLLSSAYDENKKPSYNIHINSDSYELIIDELNSDFNVLRSPDCSLNNISFKLLFQSQLTGLLVTELDETQTCELPCLKESKALHLPFLDCLYNFISASKYDFENLPIT